MALDIPLPLILFLLNGLTQLGLLIFGCYLGFFFISKSKKTHADLLLFLGLGTIGRGLNFQRKKNLFSL